MGKNKIIHKLYKILNKFDLSPITKLNYRNGQIIMSKNLKSRYYYSETIEGKNKDKKITIIMFNLAKANIDKPDKTINNVYKIIKTYTNYKEFEIFNLFNIRNSNPSCKKEAGLQTNLKLLEELLNVEKNNNILLAWGNLLYEKYKLNQTELELLKHILDKKNLFIVKFTNKKNPIHLSTRNNRYIYPLNSLIQVKISQETNFKLIKTQ